MNYNTTNMWMDACLTNVLTMKKMYKKNYC